MRIEMKMPDLSTASSTVKIVAWLVKPGQGLKRGQPLLEVETDKAAMEVEAYLNGTLLEIVAAPDTDVEVGQTIAWIETSDVEVEMPPPLSGKPNDTPVPQPQASRPVEVNRPRGMFNRNREKVSGPAGADKPQPRLSAAQRVTAQRTLASKQNIPHFYLQTSANAEPMTARRDAALQEKPLWDAFIVSALGIALKKHERMRASFQDGTLVPPTMDAVGVAVDLDGDLFIVPIDFPAQKSPEQISVEIRRWVGRLRAGDADARKILPANITVSNLGGTGIETFTAIINPPEAAILAIGKIAPVVVAVDGEIRIQQRVSLTLSVDHRVVNGKYAAEFLQSVVAELEAL